MKIFRKLVCWAFVVLLLLSLSSMAFAASVETYYGDLRISVSTDKNAYNETDIAEITAIITNVGNNNVNNVKVQVVFDDLAPVSKKTSETSKSVATLKAGESISLKYKATLNAKAHKLSFFQKIILWFKRLFKGGYNVNNKNIDFVVQNITDIKFGKFTAENIVQAECELNKVDEFENIDSPTYEELIENVDIDEMYEYDDTNRVIDEEYGIEYLDNIIIIMFEDDCTDEEKAKIVNFVNGKVVGGDTLYNELYIEVKRSTLRELEKLCEELENFSNVDLATPEEFIYTINSIPTDPWGNTLGKWNAEVFGINENNWWALATELRSAWEYDEYFSNINIGIADVGFDTYHEEYSTKFKLISKENSSDNHGTHVTGIIGAQHNNEKGLSGVINKCFLVGYDLAKASGKFKSDTEALKALKVLVEDYKCKVINFSIGTNIYVRNNGCYSDEKCKKAVSEKDVYDWGYKASKKIGKLLEKGNDFIVVQSAGNGAKNTKLGIDAVNNGAFCSITKENCYSSNKISKEEIMDRVIIVANANKDKYATDDYSLNSNSNGNDDYVDIAAPGTNIYSTIAGIEEKNDDGTIKYSAGQKYGTMSGTSMAAPIVTGVAGLVWSVNEDFTGSMVKKIVTSSAEQGGILVKDNDTSPTTGDFYLVNAKLAVEKAMILTYGTCTIKGSFVDEDGNALSGVNIVATNKETGKKVCGLNNNDGTFSLLLPTGTYNIEFSKYDSKSIVDTEKLTKGQVLDLGEDWLFVGKSYVTGTVTDKSTGEPISGVTVNSMHNLYDSYNSTATTDENGCFRMEIQRGDNYYIGFEHNDYDYFGVEKDITLAETDLGNIELSKPALASGNCGADGDNVTWTLYEDGELVISGNGAMEDYVAKDYNISAGNSNVPMGYTNAPWFGSQINKVSIREGVTTVGEYAFSLLPNLLTVSIAKTVESINDYAFGNSRKLEYIFFENNSELNVISSCAFNNCYKLKEINLEVCKSLKTIGNSAFSKCERLESIFLNKSIAKIGSLAFNHCYSLNYIEYDIPDLQQCGECIFTFAGEYSSKLDVVFTDNVINIPEYLLVGYYYNSVNVSCQNANVTSIVVGKNVINIGNLAFAYCDKLVSVEISDSVEKIGRMVFYNCPNLKTINVNSKNKYYTSIDGVLFNKNKTELIHFPAKNATQYTIPNGTESICEYAFADCYSLTNIIIPETVLIIGNNAFKNCALLEKVTIPQNVSTIEEDAFFYCQNLQEIIILNPSCQIVGYGDTISNSKEWQSTHGGYYSYNYNGVIYGYNNSTAQAYAEKYNRNFIAID